jgi:predicted nucleotidyltransferase
VIRDRIIEVANAIRSARYPDADAVLAAGSILRGEGTASSDLDLVVVYARLPSAYRESFRFEGYPVEAFVHDPETLTYFSLEVDRPAGVPVLAQMIAEGVEIPSPNDLSCALKKQAAGVIVAGPPALDAETEQRLRYAVTDMLDDLRSPRSRAELIGTAAQLYGHLADYHLRRLGLWSARGKAIPRTLHRVDPDLCARYGRSFDRLFEQSDPSEVIQLAEELLEAAGGLLFDGYRADAPPTWRQTPLDSRLE